MSLFKKSQISNTEIMNKIMVVENKLDLFLSKVENDNPNDCCKNYESQIYNEIKDYINHKFIQIEGDICNKIKDVDSNVDNVKNLFNNYRNDVITNIEFIIDHIYKETQLFKDNVVFNKISEMFNTVNGEVLKNIDDLYKNISCNVKTIKEDIYNLESKINYINYDNELVSKNLRIEEDLRKYEDEYNHLCIKIAHTINDINQLLETI